jgi:hypothetical protein
MKKHILSFLTALLLTNTLCAMKQFFSVMSLAKQKITYDFAEHGFWLSKNILPKKYRKNGPWNSGDYPTNTPNEIVLISNRYGKFVKETYDCYFSSLRKTALYNDVKKCMCINKKLFADLCVQASKETQLDQKPFQELLSKINKKEIDTETIFYEASLDYTEIVKMTKKDGYHRLLSYIRRGPIHSLINGRTIEMEISYKETGEEKIWAHFNPYLKDKDASHHKEIVKKFEELVQKASHGN